MVRRGGAAAENSIAQRYWPEGRAAKRRVILLPGVAVSSATKDVRIGSSPVSGLNRRPGSALAGGAGIGESRKVGGAGVVQW